MRNLPSFRIARSSFATGAVLLVVGSLGGFSDSDIRAAAEGTTAPTVAGDGRPPVVAPEPEGSVDVAKLMQPHGVEDRVVGDPDAPVTIVEYASMTCDHCARFHNESLPTIKRDYIDTGKVKMIIREFPFDPVALAAFMLARCAPNDNREKMIEVLFSQGETWAHADNPSEKLLGISKLAGFTDESFKACLSDKEMQKRIVETKERGQFTFGVDSTPTFFIQGDKYRGALPAGEMAAVLDKYVAAAD
ncbi:DsbA family protein [Antarcticirhabdus aurantiaca]|uniref:DsbA family protein n=1 Tax=Antarcticirhabdus aurantiaca TaxID=2606717 RepID=A0ACD4NWW9_9HYPH|nr:DsbA family protein [Antarcticirhabdus aurantiaca]WAJ31265.1 DsbA family protein [Jeongeuplla avenae]